MRIAASVCEPDFLPKFKDWVLTVHARLLEAKHHVEDGSESAKVFTNTLFIDRTWQVSDEDRAIVESQTHVCR